MTKERLIKKLANLYGIKSKYFDANGVLHRVSAEQAESYLKALNINTLDIESLEKELYSFEKNEWSRITAPILIYKVSAEKTIKFKIPAEFFDKEIFYKLENGNISIQDNFIPKELNVVNYRDFGGGKAFYEVELDFSHDVEVGDHKLYIWAEGLEGQNADFIVAPDRAYAPKNFRKNSIRGSKLKLHELSSRGGLKPATTANIKKTIKKSAQKNDGIVGLGSINSLSNFALEEFKCYYPSTKLMFNPLYLDVDEIVAFLGDKTLEIQLLSEEFQQKYKELEEAEVIDYLQLKELKFKIYKVLYQSFRENHILLKTKKAEEFYNYLDKKGENFRKIAVFEALKEHFQKEGYDFISWHDWAKTYQDPYSDTVKDFENTNIELVEFYEFLQWRLEWQLFEAGMSALKNNLKVGMYTDISLKNTAYGADEWLNQQEYAFKSTKGNGFKLVPFKPHELKNSRYNTIRELLTTNMHHVGALKLCSLEDFETLSWSDAEGNDFEVEYPFEDVVAIVALESVKNKCIAVIDDFKNFSAKARQILQKYGFVEEKAFNLIELNNDEVFNEYFSTKIKTIDNQIAKIPTATYRLQFNKDFTFKDAKNIIPYLKNLGISHCYASPILQARKDSTHGYDIINHREINPQIGSRAEFYEFSGELHRNGMGLILDIVPNHMGIGHENRWWMDVLENGQSSEFASYFDIDWHPIKKELQNKLLVPVLGEHYGNVLENGGFQFKFYWDDGKIKLFYYDHEFPLNPSTYPLILNYRLEVLESRLGSNHHDFLEYQSIINVFENLPPHYETDIEQIKIKRREQTIAFERLRNIAKANAIIGFFVEENIKDFQNTKENPFSREMLHNLLENQAYRLSYWRVSIDEINYRRFFDVNDLAGLCVENPAVFADTHSFILDLIEQRTVDGLRLDHPDGLLEPTNYFKHLQSEIAKRLNVDFNVENTDEEILLSSDKLPAYVIAEKILAPFEKIPKNWAIHGTVGYDFLNNLQGLYINSRNRKVFTKIYEKFIGGAVDYHALTFQCKKIIMKISLAGELSTLSNYLNNISENYHSARDYTLNNIRDALITVIANFPVYRTYLSSEEKEIKATDYIKWAIGVAKKQSAIVDGSIFDFIEKVLTLELEEDKESKLYNDILKFTMKFQQYTSPLMAKGLEDTAFYRYNRLICLNEVGSEPDNFGVDPDYFHSQNLECSQKTPHSMLATSTHDTKRSEDVRARIAVLSEIPELWQKKINRWSQLNRLKKTKLETGLCPSKNDEYLFYQALIGIWENDKPVETIIQRIEDYMIKAIREAKVYTSWVNINEQYEEAVKNFIRRVLTSLDKHPFWAEFLPFVEKISKAGKINSISQTLLKLTSPGVCDIYQGNEDFTFNLVDPDNRGVVDFSKLQEKINNLEKFKKLYTTFKVLNFRAENQKLFKLGEYIPLEVEGIYANKVIAFARKYKNKTLIVVAPRFVYELITDENPLALGDVWQDTRIILPAGIEAGKCILNDVEGELELSKLFKKLPIANLFCSENKKLIKYKV